MKHDSGRQSLLDRLHRDRGRQLHEIHQSRQLDRRVSFISLKSRITLLPVLYNSSPCDQDCWHIDLVAWSRFSDNVGHVLA